MIISSNFGLLITMLVSSSLHGRNAVVCKSHRSAECRGTGTVHEHEASMGPAAFAVNHPVSYPAGTVSSSQHLRALPVSHLLLPLALICFLSKEEAFWLFKLLMLPSSMLLPFQHPSSVLLAQWESPELILPISPAREAAELLRAVISPGALLSSSHCPLIPCLPQHCSWE